MHYGIRRSFNMAEGETGTSVDTNSNTDETHGKHGHLPKPGVSKNNAGEVGSEKIRINTSDPPDTPCAKVDKPDAVCSRVRSSEGSRRPQSEFPGAVSCQWLDCNAVLNARYELSEHVRTCHVEPMTSHEVFVCLWRGCKVFNKPSLSHSWLSKHVNTHTGDKPFKCMISGCYLSFSSQEGLARHVPSHFKEPTQPKRNKSDDSPKKALKRNRIKLVQRRRPPVQAAKEDFVNHQTVKSIKKRLPHIVPVSCYGVGVNGTKIVLQSKVLGRRTDEKTGSVDVLLHWLPENILPDEWRPLSEAQEHKSRTVHISQLPNDVVADLDPSFYRKFSLRKHHRK